MHKNNNNLPRADGFSPKGVSTLRGSYGCGPQLLPAPARAKVPLWNVHIHFDRAGSHKVWTTVLSLPLVLWNCCHFLILLILHGRRSRRRKSYWYFVKILVKSGKVFSHDLVEVLLRRSCEILAWSGKGQCGKILKILFKSMQSMHVFIHSLWWYWQWLLVEHNSLALRMPATGNALAP